MSLEPITMPVLSDTMETGHLVSWKKQISDTVKKGDTLAEVESDKAIMDIEAFHGGYLADPLAQADSNIPVGTTIGYIADNAHEALQHRTDTGIHAHEYREAAANRVNRNSALPARAN
ncbi:MAG: hypothetical protein DSZ28_09385 [Thiothrix sp.]|nr:MAG: hypothetical protein DSZ28_09385 [Thiothrix sp.]